MVVEGCPEPEELIAATRPITAATGRAVTVGKSGNTSEILQVCREPVEILKYLCQYFFCSLHAIFMKNESIIHTNQSHARPVQPYPCSARETVPMFGP